jgi:queuine tRNA-ribosyltransferase
VAKITEEGVTFRSYRDGAKILMTPESSVLIQKDLGADIIIPFDELPPYHIDPRKLKKSLDRTHRWEKRSLEQHLQNPNQQAMYAVIHGGINQEFRSLSCKTLTNLPFDGFAIGGSVGKNHDEMVQMLQYTTPQLPVDKPNHLLGIGDLISIPQIVPLGIDTFDSTHPTKSARHGHLFTSQGTKKIIRSVFKQDFTTIDPACNCHTCKNYTASYLHHLFKAKEPIASTLATIHNIAFMTQLMKQYRERILQGDI